MRWKKGPLDELEVKMPPSDWEFESKHGQAMFTYLTAAHDWSMLPSVMGLCDPEDDAALMASFTMTRNRMRAWERHVEKVDREKNK